MIPPVVTLADRIKTLATTPGARITVTGPFALHIEWDDCGAHGAVARRLRVACEHLRCQHTWTGAGTSAKVTLRRAEAA